MLALLAFLLLLGPAPLLGRSRCKHGEQAAEQAELWSFLLLPLRFLWHDFTVGALFRVVVAVLGLLGPPLALAPITASLHLGWLAVVMGVNRLVFESEVVHVTIVRVQLASDSLVVQLDVLLSFFDDLACVRVRYLLALLLGLDLILFIEVGVELLHEADAEVQRLVTAPTEVFGADMAVVRLGGIAVDCVG